MKGILIVIVDKIFRSSQVTTKSTRFMPFENHLECLQCLKYLHQCFSSTEYRKWSCNNTKPQSNLTLLGIKVGLRVGWPLLQCTWGIIDFNFWKRSCKTYLTLIDTRTSSESQSYLLSKRGWGYELNAMW